MGSRSLDGWLQKLAKTTSSGKEMWQRRWFVLQGDTLSFFNSMDDAANASATVGLQLKGSGRFVDGHTAQLRHIVNS